MVCDSISSLLGAACARQRGHLEANFPYRSRERRSRVWDHFRPVHLWMNAHFVGNLLGFFFFLHPYKGEFWFSRAEQGRPLFMNGPCGIYSSADIWAVGKETLGRGYWEGIHPPLPFWGPYPSGCISTLQHRCSSWQRPPGSQQG